MSYSQVFGGATIYPSQVTYLALTITADTTLQWPLESTVTDDVVARIMDITSNGSSLIMPDATLTAPGQTALFNNVGASTFVVKNSTGGTIASIPVGTQWQVYLSDNATAAGTWDTFQMGASTATVQASALAGLGLAANGALLQQTQPVNTFNSDYTLGVSDRAAAYVWTGGLGTLTLLSATDAGDNWFVAVRNGGAGNLTLAASGLDEINGATSLILTPGDSATLITDGVDFWTIGLGQDPTFSFNYTSIDLAGGSGDYTLTGSELNRISYQFIGTLSGNVVVRVPNTTQQYWVANDTDGGAFTLSIGTTAQATPVGVGRAVRGIYYCTGSTVVNAATAGLATPVPIAEGGTGATTAPGARVNLGGTTTGIAVFTAASASAGRSALSAASSGANSDITSLTGLTTPLSAAQGGTGVASLGTGVATAFGQNVTGSGGIVLGTSPTLTTPSLGTPSALVLTNATGTPTSLGLANATGLSLTTGVTGTLPIANGGTGITSFGTGVAIALGQNVTGSGGVVLGTSPTLTTPSLGTPSALVLTNATGLPMTTGVTGTLPVANGGTGAASLTANYVLLGNGTSALQGVAPGTTGNVLVSDGTTWLSSAASSAQPGDILFTSAASPSGYLPCDGGLYLQSSYTALLAALGVLFRNPTKLSNPASLPAGIGFGAAWTGDDAFMAVAHTTTPYVTIYSRSGTTFTKLTDPAALPAGDGKGVSWTVDGSHLAVAHTTTPYVTIYSRSGTTFTKLTDPAALPAGNATGAAFSQDGAYLAVSHTTTPYVTIYSRSGNVFTKLADPSSLPAGNATGAAFSQDGAYLAVSHATTPYVTIYSRSGDVFTKLANPSSLPSGTATGAAFSPDGNTLVVGSNTTPYIFLYQFQGGVFARLPDPATLPAGAGEGVSFSPDGVYLTIAHATTPYVTIYQVSGVDFLKIPNPATLPTGTGRGVSFSGVGTFLAVANNTSPYVTIYGPEYDTTTNFITPLIAPSGPGAFPYIKT